jgi:hypothetical protein
MKYTVQYSSTQNNLTYSYTAGRAANRTNKLICEKKYCKESELFDIYCDM